MESMTVYDCVFQFVCVCVCVSIPWKDEVRCVVLVLAEGCFIKVLYICIKNIIIKK